MVEERLLERRSVLGDEDEWKFYEEIRNEDEMLDRDQVPYIVDVTWFDECSLMCMNFSAILILI